MRTFLALQIDKETKKKVNSYINRFKNEIKSRVKWVEEENLHFTIFFFGEIDINISQKIINVIDANKRNFKPFKVELKGISFFPNTKNPRVIFFDVSKGANEMKNIYEILYPEINKITRIKKESFVPHLTIGRIKDILFEDDIKILINEKIDIREFLINKITFFESKLTPDGPIYKSIKDFEF
jgi:2'-5' RNA ligase